MTNVQQFAALAAASRAIHSAGSVPEVLEVVAAQGRLLIGAHQCAVSLVDLDGGHSQYALSLSDRYERWRTYDERPRGEGIYTIVGEQTPSIRMTQDELEAHPAFRDFGTSKADHPAMRGWLAAALTSRRGGAIGLIQLTDRYSGDFTEEDEIILVQFAGIASLAMENARSLAIAMAAEDRLRRYLDSSLDIICTVDGDGRFQDLSSNCSEILGYAPAELIGRAYIEFVHPDDRPASTAEEQSVKDGHATRSFANRYIRRDGGIVHLHWSSAWSATDGLFYCVVRDLTERVELENRLRRSERLETIGQLTGGIAHDFNNLLTIILGSAEALVEGLKDRTDLLELAELTRGAGERGAELTSRLLAFARRQPLSPRLVNLPELLTGLEPLIRRSIGDHIKTTILLPEEPVHTLVDPTQLETALLNLCINSRDAMPEGGQLSVKLSAVTLDEVFASQSESLPPGSYACIAVCDEGVGMSAHTKERAFEPFFTTKGPGEGTGLGLSMVYGFIRQSGGIVRIYSEHGHGTTIKLYLPLQANVALPEVETGQAAPRGSASVLVVEDDQLLRLQVVRQLTELGYAVTAAENGRAALTCLRERDFSLLFSDVVMPGGMSGRQLADAARVLQPGIKVLLTSGYTEDAIALRGEHAGYPLLSKPYRKLELARRIEEALGADSSQWPTVE